MAKLKNYYQILEIDLYAPSETVKSAFRKLARRYHPDLNPDDKGAEERFKEINEAYEVLTDPQKRAFYDKSLQLILQAKPVQETKKTASGTKKQKTEPTGSSPKAAAGSGEKKTANASEKTTKPKAEPTGSATPINELFENFIKKNIHTHSQNASGSPKSAGTSGQASIFNNAAANNTKDKPRRGEDVFVDTPIAPAEAEAGVVKTVNVQHNEICRRCSGTGRLNNLLCSGCQGEKITIRLKKMDVRIPAGVKNGSKVRVSGEGGRGGNGGENGDLFLIVQIITPEKTAPEKAPSEKASGAQPKPSANLRIEGFHVYCDLPVSVTTAILGAELDVPTLAGSVKMMIPPLTSSGKVFRLKEMGIQNSHTKGDQFVTIQIMAPDKLTSRERELYQELARLRGE